MKMICYKMKKAEAQEEIKKYFLKPVIDNLPNDAAANKSHTEKTTPIQSQSNEHTWSETSAPTPSVLQPKLKHPSSLFTFPKRNSRSQNRSCQPQWFSEHHCLEYKEVNDSVTCFICKKHSFQLVSTAGTKPPHPSEFI